MATRAALAEAKRRRVRAVAARRAANWRETRRRVALYELAIGRTLKEIMARTKERPEWVGVTLGGLCAPVLIQGKEYAAVLTMQGDVYVRARGHEKIRNLSAA